MWSRVSHTSYAATSQNRPRAYVESLLGDRGLEDGIKLLNRLSTVKLSNFTERLLPTDCNISRGLETYDRPWSRRSWLSRQSRHFLILKPCNIRRKRCRPQLNVNRKAYAYDNRRQGTCSSMSYPSPCPVRCLKKPLKSLCRDFGFTQIKKQDKWNPRIVRKANSSPGFDEDCEPKKKDFEMRSGIHHMMDDDTNLL